MQRSALWPFSALFLLLLLAAPNAYGQILQSYDARFVIQYPIGQTTIDPRYGNNYYAMAELKRFFHTVDIARVDSMVIVGSSSPEGEGRRNFILAYERAESLQNFICTEFPYASRNLMHIYAKGDTWSDMLQAIKRDPQFPNKEHTLIVLGVDQAYTDRLKLLKFLEYKDSHRYLTQVIFPRLRNSTAFVIYYKSDEPFVVHGTPEEFEKRPETTGTSMNVDQLLVAPSFIAPSFLAPALQESAPVIAADTDDAWSREVYYRVKKPLFALKTNLLFDALTLVNIGLEIPIGAHFSVAGDVIFPWWLNENKQNSLYVFNANIEGKYWFGNRTHRPQMTGWFAGLYVGGGYYDLEWNRTGYQGEFFIAAGVSGGYAHTINKGGTLRMEYSLGIGYMQTNYRKYEAKYGSDDAWHLYRRESGVYKWFGPTRLQVSLVWLLNGHRKGGRNEK